MTPRDVVIIGGGLAGGAAASQLAKRGVDVLLLEKEAGAHHKVCGEFISYEAQYYLQRLGIDLHALGAQRISRLRLVKGSHSIDTPLGFDALSLSRQCLDEAVLSHAHRQGADVRYGVTVTGVVKQAAHWLVTSTGHERVLAKSLFLATGKYDLRGWAHRVGAQNDYIGFKMHLEITAEQRLKLADAVEIILFKGGYAGLELIENNKANLCLVVTKQQFATCQNWNRLLDHLMESTPALALYLIGARPCWDKPLAIFGIPYGFVYKPKRDDPDNLFRLGDQMAVIPSLCGDGMAIALHTGFLAAEHDIQTGAVAYHAKMRRQLLGQISRATALSRLSSFFQLLAVPVIRIFPSLIAQAISHTRVKNID